MNVTHEQLIDLMRGIHARPNGTGAMLNLIRGSEVTGATDIAALIDLVSNPKLKLDLARHAFDESRHAYILLRRMSELGFPASRLPPELDRVEAIFARSRARDVKEVLIDRGSVSDAETMELVVAAYIVERDAEKKLQANYEAVAFDDRTQAVFGSMMRDEARHVRYLEDWMHWFERRFAPRAVKAARDRLDQAFVDIDVAYYAALPGYFAQAAAVEVAEPLPQDGLRVA